MGKHWNWHRAGKLLLTLALALTMVTVELSPVLAVTKADIQKLETEAKALDKKKQELEKQLKDLANDKAEVLTRRKGLDEKITNTSSQIANTEAQIAVYADLITQTEAELANAEAQEAAQYELFCQRVRAMEEQGNVDYWSVLFRATSFSDLLGRLDIINEIMDYDQRVISDLKTLQAEITAKKEELEGNKAQSEAAKANLVNQKRDLDQQRQDAIALAKEIQDNEDDYEAALKKIDREEEEIQARIVKLSRELAAQQNVPTSSGGYIWPVDSRYITSTVGGRTSPGGVGSTNHKGTDIGRVGYNSKIYAAKAGTVIVSQYGSAYGNYVVVSHGSGNTTLYAHMSSRSVKVGDYVEQGAVLGITGSTGNSTGPHLHFEITENGVRINPLSHGAEPKKGYLGGYTLSGTSVGK